jgi:hypothetical protein
MRLLPFDRDGAEACRLPEDAARMAGCDSLVPLHFPGGAGAKVLEGTVPGGRRACWTVRLEAGRRLEARLTSSGGGGGASVEVRSLGAGGAWRRAGRWESFSGSSISSTSIGNTSISTSSVSSTSVGGTSIGGVSSGRSETVVSIGPQPSGGEFLLAVTAARGGAASYRLEVQVR